MIKYNKNNFFFIYLFIYIKKIKINFFLFIYIKKIKINFFLLIYINKIKILFYNYLKKIININLKINNFK